MIHKGIELKEITTPQVFDPPKKMFVWDNGVKRNEPSIQTVYAVIQKATGTTQAIGECCRWSHCAEIPEEPKPRRATNRELSKWLSANKGEYRNHIGLVSNAYTYDASESDTAVPILFTVRKWDDTDWHEPTVDYMGIDLPLPGPSPDELLDYEMNVVDMPKYLENHHVKIGNQIWMSENLFVTDSGDGIHWNKDNGEWYYTWEAAKRIADKIPGWHLPAVKEWDELLEAIGGDGADLRVESWNGTNKYGFSAVPAGRWDNGPSEVGSYARFWTSLQLGSYGINRNIDSYTCVYEGYYSQKLGLSVRLVKDK